MFMIIILIEIIKDVKGIITNKKPPPLEKDEGGMMKDENERNASRGDLSLLSFPNLSFHLYLLLPPCPITVAVVTISAFPLVIAIKRLYSFFRKNPDGGA